MSTSARVQSRFQPGTVIEDKYEIIRHLGEGGFASVFLARQRLIDREVAIKILHTKSGEAGGASFEDRFLLEAKVAARIAHPNVVTIYDFGFTGPDREPFLVMEFLDGRELEDEIKLAGGMAPSRAIPLFVTALRALGEGHDTGVVHKDLKPANLFLTAPGTGRETLKILDFGVARLVESDKKMTSTGQMFGTPQYMAPEYIERNIVTPALDVYQMGLILVEAITGECVVDADTSYLCCVAHCRGELEIPASLLDGPLGAVLMRALAVAHQERFANANEFADALAAVDTAAVRYSPSDRSSRRLSSVSGSLRGVAANSAPHDTGGFSAGNTGGLAYTSTAAAERPQITGVGTGGFDSPPKKKSSIGVLLGVAALLLLLILGAGGAVAALLMADGDDAAESAALAVAEQDDPAEGAAKEAGEDEPDEANSEDEDEDEANKDSKDEAAVAEADKDKVDKDDESDGKEAPNDAPAELSKTIELDTTPSGATVYRGRKKLGVTPIAIPRPQKDTTFSLKLKRFEPASITVKPDADANVGLALAAKSRNVRAVARTKVPAKKEKVEVDKVRGSGKMVAPKPKSGFDFADGKKPSKTKETKKKSGGFGFAE